MIAQTSPKNTVFFPLTTQEWAMNSKKLTHAQLQVYYYLRTLTGPWRDRQVEIRINDLAKDLDLNRSTVSRAIQHLKKEGLIDMELLTVGIRITATNYEDCDRTITACDRAIAPCDRTITSDIYNDRARASDSTNYLDSQLGEKILEGRGSHGSLATSQNELEALYQSKAIDEDHFSAAGHSGDVESHGVGHQGNVSGSATGHFGNVGSYAVGHEGNVTGLEGHRGNVNSQAVGHQGDVTGFSACGHKGDVSVSTSGHQGDVTGYGHGHQGGITSQVTGHKGNVAKPTQRELAEVVRQLREWRINPDECIAVVHKYWPNVTDAIAYLHEAFIYWPQKPHSPTRLFLVACKEGRKPEISYRCGLPSEVNPPSAEQLSMLIEAKSKSLIKDYFLSQDGVSKVVMPNMQQIPWWDFLKVEPVCGPQR